MLALPGRPLLQRRVPTHALEGGAQGQVLRADSGGGPHGGGGAAGGGAAGSGAAGSGHRQPSTRPERARSRNGNTQAEAPEMWQALDEAFGKRERRSLGL